VEKPDLSLCYIDRLLFTYALVAYYVLLMSTYSDEHVYMSVCLHTYLRNYTSKFFHISCAKLHVAHVAAVLFWRRCETLCTSGFAGDVIFPYTECCGPYGGMMLTQLPQLCMLLFFRLYNVHLRDAPVEMGGSVPKHSTVFAGWRQQHERKRATSCWDASHYL